MWNLTVTNSLITNQVLISLASYHISARVYGMKTAHYTQETGTGVLQRWTIKLEYNLVLNINYTSSSMISFKMMIHMDTVPTI